MDKGLKLRVGKQLFYRRGLVTDKVGGAHCNKFDNLEASYIWIGKLIETGLKKTF